MIKMRATIVMLCLYLKYPYVYCSGEEKSVNVIDEGIVDNVSETKYNIRSKRDFLPRTSRFVSFNKETNKLRVEASFAIPLLTIPIGGRASVATSEGNVMVPKVDVNLKSVVTLASIFLLVFIILPKLLHLDSASTPMAENFYRSDPSGINNNSNNIETIIKRLSETFEAHNMDFDSCTQKAFCWTMNNAVSKVKEGKASGVEKLLDAVSSMPYLKYLFEDTWLWSVIDKAIFFRNSEHAESCEKFSQKCSITSKGLNLAAGSLLSSIKNRKL